MNDTIRKIAFVCAVVMLYSNAYASQDFTTATTLSVGAQQVKPSNHVTIRITSNTSAFAAQASHSTGDRRYGTSYTDTKVNWSTGTTLDTINATSVFTGSGWSAL